MKTIYAFAMILVCASVFDKTSHAYEFACPNGNSSSGCGNDSEAFWLTSTTTFNILAIVASGEVDLSNPATRDLLLSQAEQVLNGQGSAINESENLVHALAMQNGVSDESLAQVVKSLEGSGSEITVDSIRGVLSLR